MPLFSNKFSPKKPPPRKTAVHFNSDTPLEGLISDGGVVKLQLGQQKFNFENGDWKPLTGESSSTYKSNQKLKQKLLHVEEENNLLKLKMEVLLNMLTETTAENHLQQREIDNLRKIDTNE